jgi:anthranilate synthase component 1
VVSNAIVRDQTPSEVERAYRESQQKIEAIIAALRRPMGAPAGSTGRSASEEPESTFTRPRFCDAVRRAKEYIQAGDVIQVVLSQRLALRTGADPFDVYRALRIVNPSPYMYYLRLGELKIVGSSPEMLVRLEGDRIDVRPIAGTRPRGGTEEEDRGLAAELVADPKERAEHIMLVDLGRNDVGKVAQTGSVTVPTLMSVERYSHVMHLVSHVRGLAEPGRTAFDVLGACFPAGTVTGAPKVRAMEIIEELEPTRRGPYAGAVGYVSFTGNLDTCITIRTILFSRGTAFIQAGAGIVADSDPEREYEETMNKARALRRAIELAEEGLD